MNFFQHQDRARANTWRLVGLFAIAVVLIVAAIYGIVLGCLRLAFWKYPDTYVELLHDNRFDAPPQADAPLPPFDWWQPEVLGMVAIATLLIIGMGSLYKILTMGAGGFAVAMRLGGRPVDPDTTDPAERRLLNVVEEMAIASGLPVPMVCILNREESINAFAAGFTPNDAVIGVTYGCMSLLKRDELQGVVAHEFSHILNGDMRLNLRLIGILHGILLIGLIGLGIMRGIAYGGRTRSSGRGGGAAVIALLVIGAALTIVGYLGVFFGRIIKAAVSRQREFLADASAVAFTRNPDGVADALKKIGGYGKASRILSDDAETHSHLFFGDFRVRGFAASTWLSTHPSLELRIKRIDPAFDGTFSKITAPAKEKKDAQLNREAKASAREATRRAGGRILFDPDNIIGQIGAPTAAHLLYGAALLEALPDTLRAAAHSPAQAVCLVYALVLDEDLEVRKAQLELLQGALKLELVQEIARLFELRESLNTAARLPLIDLAVPALRKMNDKQCRGFVALLKRLIDADERVSIFEFALDKLLRHRLERAVEKPRRREVRYHGFTPVMPDCLLVLSILARAGHADDAKAAIAHQAGLNRLPTSVLGRISTELLPAEQCTFSALEPSLDHIALCKPVIKQRIVDALAHCVLKDGQVTVEEAELLRAICHCIDCPLPPFLPSAMDSAPPQA